MSTDIRDGTDNSTRISMVSRISLGYLYGRSTGRSIRAVKANPCFRQSHTSFKDIPAQWAKITQGLDIFRISSKCVCLSNGEV